MATVQSSSDLSIDDVKQRVRTAMVAAGIAHKINSRSTELTENSEVVLRRRYLSKDREGNVLEDPDGMFRRVARNLSQAELNYGPITEEERLSVEDEYYGVMRRAGVHAQLANPDERGPGTAAAFRLLRPSRGRFPGLHL